MQTLSHSSDTHWKGTSYVKIEKTPSGKFEVLDYPGLLFVVSITL